MTTLYPTKTRMRLLAAVSDTAPGGGPRIYRQAGRFYDAVSGFQVTAAVCQQIRHGWLEEAPGDRPGKTTLRRTPLGERILLQHGNGDR
jgi:hypothetical protein